MEVAAEMLDYDLSWELEALSDEGRQIVTAIGSSPADQTVEVVEIHVQIGEQVKAGQLLACLEGDKAVVELASPTDGVIEAIHLRIGDKVTVDSPLMTLGVERARQKQPSRERADIPILTPRKASRPSIKTNLTPQTVVMTGLGVCRGRDQLGNEQLTPLLPTLTSPDLEVDGIFERTGIKARLVAAEGQDAVNMAVEAASLALKDANVKAEDISLVICSTSTPSMIAPSMACLVLQRLAPASDIPAYDLLAACSGYLYALANAWDYLQQTPSGKVLVVTAETMRRVTNIDDPDTSPIFGDAATATILSTCGTGADGLAILNRPVLSARGDDGTALRVPITASDPFIKMDGKRIFSEAIRRMGQMLTKACVQSALTLADLDLIVPHQANGRIIEAMRKRLRLSENKVWNEIRYQGNTSSSSIPLALDTVLRRSDKGPLLGLTSFGAGYTFAGAVLQKPCHSKDCNGAKPEIQPETLPG